MIYPFNINKIYRDQYNNLFNTGSIDTIVSETSITLPAGFIPKPRIQPQVSEIKCVCGASKTSNPTLHTDWCDLYVKT
jgi:hypothetical protein